MANTSASEHHKAKPNPVGHSPIEAILLVEKFRYEQRHYRFSATSLPGHLIQLVVSGQVRQECNGRRYELNPGAAIWYYDDETVRGQTVQEPWEFYSVNFIAPLLSPPPFEKRLLAGMGRLQGTFGMLLRHWQRNAPERTFQCHALLLQLLTELNGGAECSPAMDPRAQLWWELETMLRRDLAKVISIDHMVKLAGYSAATVARACRYATGMTPWSRIKQVRLSFARGLLRQSGFSVTEVANKVGYGRVQEFSRDFHRNYGHTPTLERERNSER